MEINGHTVYYASGSTLAMFPTNNSFIYSADLKDQSEFVCLYVLMSMCIVDYTAHTCDIFLSLMLIS